MEIYMVGGAVRDRLMGLEPKDIDYVVVGATAEDMLAKGFKQVGADFPVFLSDDGTEYALARTERKSGRGYNGFEVNADTSVTLEDDLARRDLTINAMAFQPGNDYNVDGLFDPFNGQADLKNKVLRHVSPAFADDPVRVLRLARFHARYGAEWTVDPLTVEFCRLMAQNDELSYLTRERVWAEAVKALSEQEPWLFFETLEKFGALVVVFPELAVPSVYVAMTEALRFAPSRSPFLNYAVIAQLLVPGELEAFEARYRVGNDFKNYARMFRAAFGSWRTPTVDRLYEMDVFRNVPLWEQIRDEALASHSAPLKAVVSSIDEAYNAVKHVNFETLPEDIRGNLKGAEIAAAIKRQRVFAFETYRKNRS